MVTFSLKEIDEAIVLAVSLTSRRVYRVLSTPCALFSRDLNIYKTTEYGFVVRTMFVRDVVHRSRDFLSRNLWNRKNRKRTVAQFTDIIRFNEKRTHRSSSIDLKYFVKARSNPFRRFAR